MIIDAHHHLWDPADRPYPWMDDSVAPIRRRFDVDDLRAAARSADVTRTIVVQAVHDPGETAWLLEQPEPVAGVVGWVDLTAPDVVDRIAALIAGSGGGRPASSQLAGNRPASTRLVGIRHQAHDEPDPDWLARPEVVRGVRAVAAAGLVFDVLVRAREHRAALALLDAVPEGSFVLDHAGKPDIAGGDPGWAGRIDDFAARPNVVCKVSGLFTEAGPEWRRQPVDRYVRAVVERFGPERSLFGSDWPVSTLATTYDDVVRRTTDALADLTQDERQSVLSGTAERTYLHGRTLSTGDLVGNPRQT
ncbi:amidohydrolase family protein [Curtobacterium flaccumfaciens pv. flaccumfaciens]|uniref:amidohydrolase family protein n=1 Tax=Curtobacterium flaccumfaciens TaxID=2035 RepID=UPI0021B0994E|nr:amidohydrolase family protein [Curtobacterium flaccumfaciens]QYI96666.1 amidohydrolase family protein [Curtobacterium flaccumfaciens pv. flaccumfaciens]UXN23589.1 amidohydrolase family protein [Curtobacterium flaccumfaciens pv. flaccumfaciens]